MAKTEWKTVPICHICWELDFGDRRPVVVLGATQEVCFSCEKDTYSGIFVRAEVEVL